MAEMNIRLLTDDLAAHAADCRRASDESSDAVLTAARLGVIAGALDDARSVIAYLQGELKSEGKAYGLAMDNLHHYQREVERHDARWEWLASVIETGGSLYWSHDCRYRLQHPEWPVAVEGYPLTVAIESGVEQTKALVCNECHAPVADCIHGIDSRQVDA